MGPGFKTKSASEGPQRNVQTGFLKQTQGMGGGGYEKNRREDFVRGTTVVQNDDENE